jgi:hypothetical protein
MRRCPINTPETASASIAVENDEDPMTVMRSDMNVTSERPVARSNTGISS